MKTVLVLAALLALPLAAAVAPLPAVPATCPDACTITAASTGYDPIVATITSGTSVVFHSEDVTHVTRDQALMGPACFDVVGAGQEDAPAVRFDLAPGALFATVEGVTQPCASAVVTPAGAAIPYFCSIHPTMRGVLVVTA